MRPFINAITDNDHIIIFNKDRLRIFEITQIKTSIKTIKYHYLLNFLDPSDTQICTESVILLNDNVDFDLDKFSEYQQFGKFNKTNCKVINFYKLFNEYNADFILNISRYKSMLTFNCSFKYNFRFTINLKNQNTEAIFISEIIDCCNYIAASNKVDFDKLADLAVLLSSNLNFTKSDFDKAISLEDKLEYLVVEPKFNEDEYASIIESFLKCKRLTKFQFTLHGVKFSLGNKTPIYIEIPGFTNNITINNSSISSIKRLALILENLNIFDKFKNNINFYLLNNL